MGWRIGLRPTFCPHLMPALVEARIVAMRLALVEATAAADGMDPAAADVPVGAVILDADGAVMAQARNRREADHDPTAHAEILAIRAAARRAGQWRLGRCRAFRGCERG